MPLGFFKGVGGFGRRNVPSFAPLVATGGTSWDETIGGVSYRLHKFTSTGNSTFTVSDAGSLGTVDLLIVGGGGSGGSLPTNFSPNASGGGGGGQVRWLTNQAATAQAYTITVGGGGTATYPGVDGSSSIAFGNTAIGGKRGSPTIAEQRNGIPGGDSGAGGAAIPQGYTSASGASGTFASGSAGANNQGAGYRGAGGGGGAGGAGGNANTAPSPGTGGNAGAGGAGANMSANVGSTVGVNGIFAGGGGGGSHNVGSAPGGSGGGGAGGASFSNSAAGGGNGTANTGSGGGGHGTGNSSLFDPSTGGSGIVVVRYRLA
jgi:hypothetical protein